jgi:hypothetical protein
MLPKNSSEFGNSERQFALDTFRTPTLGVNLSMACEALQICPSNSSLAVVLFAKKPRAKISVGFMQGE